MNFIYRVKKCKFLNNIYCYNNISPIVGELVLINCSNNIVSTLKSKTFVVRGVIFESNNVLKCQKRYYIKISNKLTKLKNKIKDLFYLIKYKLGYVDKVDIYYVFFTSELYSNDKIDNFKNLSDSELDDLNNEILKENLLLCYNEDYFIQFEKNPYTFIMYNSIKYKDDPKRFFWLFVYNRNELWKNIFWKWISFYSYNILFWFRILTLLYTLSW